MTKTIIMNFIILDTSKMFLYDLISFHNYLNRRKKNSIAFYINSLIFFYGMLNFAQLDI